MSENWTDWDLENPPVEGAVATKKGWEIPLKGTPPAKNLTEVIVAIGDLSGKAGASNVVSATVLTAAGFFVEAETIDIEVVYNENVDVTGAPRTALTLDSGTVYADYASGTGTNALIFTYTVGASDLAVAGPVAVSPIDLNGGAIDDNIGGAAAGLTFTPPDMSLHIVDAVEPTILTVVTPEDGTDIDTAGIVNINVTFDENVDVVGIPQIPVFANDGTTPLAGNTGLADYVGGTGTAVLNFQYVVDAGDTEAVGIAIGADIALNGGTLKDAAGNAAVLTFIQVATTLTTNQP